MIESNRGCDFGYKPLFFNNLRFRQAIFTLVLIVWMLDLRSISFLLFTFFIS